MLQIYCRRWIKITQQLCMKIGFSITGPSLKLAVSLKLASFFKPRPYLKFALPGERKY